MYHLHCCNVQHGVLIAECYNAEPRDMVGLDILLQQGRLFNKSFCDKELSGSTMLYSTLTLLRQFAILTGSFSVFFSYIPY